MAFISNGTTVATGGSLQNVPAPSNSQILTGVASASSDAVGSYALLKRDNTNAGSTSQGTNVSGSGFRFTGAAGTNNGGFASGTWKIMGYLISGSAENNVTVGLRVS